MEGTLHASFNSVRDVGEKYDLISNSLNVRQRNSDTQWKTVLEIQAGSSSRPVVLKIQSIVYLELSALPYQNKRQQLPDNSVALAGRLSSLDKSNVVTRLAANIDRATSDDVG